MADGAQLLWVGGEGFTQPEDRIVDTWPFMSSPVPVLSIVLSYLAFVFYFGPKFMEHRKPFKLRYVLIAYNLINVSISSYLVFQVFGNLTNMKYIYNHMFNPIDRRKAPYVYQINANGWLYCVSKIIEFADTQISSPFLATVMYWPLSREMTTLISSIIWYAMYITMNYNYSKSLPQMDDNTVFFILRKKQNQVSFLHVYHHTNMALSSWVYLKYIRGEQGVIIAFINSFVHVVMYSYYLLAAFGPRVQKYLWWKKYITKLQIGQFLIVILYIAAVLICDIRFPKGFTYFYGFQAVSFLALFINFYMKTYTKKKDTTKLKGS